MDYKTTKKVITGAIVFGLMLLGAIACSEATGEPLQDEVQSQTVAVPTRLQATSPPLTDSASFTQSPSEQHPESSPEPTETHKTEETSSSTGVHIGVNSDSYSKGEIVYVTVVNNFETPITTIDQNAFCSIIILEKQDGDQWQEIVNCFSGKPSSPVTLAPGSSLAVELPVDLIPGTYRAALEFSVGERFDIGNAQTVYSHSFEVN